MIAVIILHMKERKIYLEELLKVLDKDNVDVYVKESVSSINNLMEAYIDAVKELPDEYKYVSFVDDDDLVCNEYYKMLLDNIESDSSAISASQIQFKKTDDIRKYMDNKLKFPSYGTSYLSYHGPSLILIDSLLQHVEEIKKCKIDEKRFIIKTFQKYGMKTQFCPQTGSFWRVRDKQGNYYE